MGRRTAVGAAVQSYMYSPNRGTAPQSLPPSPGSSKENAVVYIGPLIEKEDEDHGFCHGTQEGGSTCTAVRVDDLLIFMVNVE